MFIGGNRVVALLRLRSVLVRASCFRSPARTMCEIVRRPRSWFTHAEEREMMLVEENQYHERQMRRMEKRGKLESEITKYWIRYWNLTKQERRALDLQRELRNEQDEDRRRALKSELRNEMWYNSSHLNSIAEEQDMLARLTSTNTTVDRYSLVKGKQSIQV